MKNIFHLDKTGSFLFKSPTQVSIQLGSELAILFYLPTKKAYGIALYNPDENLKELQQSLETLYQKMVDTYAIDSSQLHIKIFGLRNGLKSVMEAALDWLKGNHLRITAKDIGANATRKLLIDCESGKVGVSYADANPHPLQWIAEGSARNRNPLDTVHAEVLILTDNSVKRTLAKQAIEEERHWTAATPKKPNEIMARKKVEDFPWPVVLLFEDLEDFNLIEAWISRVQLTFPAVQFRWVGTSIPSTLKRTFPELKQLPPLEPELLPEFKQKLTAALFDHSVTHTTSILPFKAKKSRS